VGREHDADVTFGLARQAPRAFVVREHREVSQLVVHLAQAHAPGEQRLLAAGVGHELALDL
jgi:hypothetical protein